MNEPCGSSKGWNANFSSPLRTGNYYHLKEHKPGNRTKSNLLKWNIGSYLALAYLILLFALWVDIHLETVGAQAGIVFFLYTLPWSMLLISAADQMFPAPDVLYFSGFLIVLSIFINMLVFHLCGAVLKALFEKFNKQ